MKKLITLLLALLLVAGCSSEKIVGGNLDDIQKRGYIIVAMEGTWAPWTYHDENDKLAGYDVEVAKYIADYLGVEVRYVEGEWDNLLIGVDGGMYDIMINGCDITEERKQAYDFSDPYAYDVTAVITDVNNTEINTLDDLKGKVTANTASSTYAKIAEEHGATVKPVDDLAETFLLLTNKEIDATINAEISYDYYMKTNPNSNFKIACYYDEIFDVGAVMKKGSTDLVNKVNEAIATAKADGTLSNLSIKYFTKDVTNLK